MDDGSKEADYFLKKADKGKRPWHLLPLFLVSGVVDVLAYGAKKYSAWSWLTVPDGHERYEAAALRHIEAWQRGEPCDEESGLHHLDHAMCCLIFLRHIERIGREMDS